MFSASRPQPAAVSSCPRMVPPHGSESGDLHSTSSASAESAPGMSPDWKAS